MNPQCGFRAVLTETAVESPQARHRSREPAGENGVYAATVLCVLSNRLCGGVDAAATADFVSFSVFPKAMHASPA